MKILVVKRKILLKHSFQGFESHEKHNYLQLIRNNYFFVEREDAEHDYGLKQPIPYVIITNNNKQIYAYQRNIKDYRETRLKGKWSIGIGGHIEEKDESVDSMNQKDLNLFNSSSSFFLSEDLIKTPIFNCLIRELNEEVYLDKSIFDLELLGYINDDSTDVGKVHFGLLFFARTASKIARPNDFESSVGKFMNIEEFKFFSGYSENWSKIAYNALINLSL